MLRKTYAAVDLSKIAHNIRVLQRAMGAEERAMAVVKANAYGPVSYTHLDVYKRQGLQAPLGNEQRGFFCYNKESRAIVCKLIETIFLRRQRDLPTLFRVGYNIKFPGLGIAGRRSKASGLCHFFQLFLLYRHRSIAAAALPFLRKF